MSDYLVHYGVKGMKWGKRKKPVWETAQERRAQNEQSIKNLESNISKLNDDVNYERAAKVYKKQGQIPARSFKPASNTRLSLVASSARRNKGRKYMSQVRLHERITSELVKNRAKRGERYFNKTLYNIN